MQALLEMQMDMGLQFRLEMQSCRIGNLEVEGLSHSVQPAPFQRIQMGLAGAAGLGASLWRV